MLAASDAAAGGAQTTPGCVPATDGRNQANPRRMPARAPRIPAQSRPKLFVDKRDGQGVGEDAGTRSRR